MSLWISGKLREDFLMFFKKKGHIIVPSSSLTNSGDTSVLLTTAGMQQFKPFYLDPAKADEELKGRRAASSQKCFRTTDIDEVGDRTHHTFFEMLGNFAFGDYFKKEAIAFAFELLTKVYKFKPGDLQVTVFAGDEKVPEDSQSRAIWESLGIPGSHIRACGREDNFWGPTGDQGPCGPTSEIYVNGVEIWNLVFNEFFYPGSRDELLAGTKGKSLQPLAFKGVDTGMGLERLANVLQGVNSNYETDVFVPLVEVVRRNTQRTDLPEELAIRSTRIIVDHMRGGTFLMAEGLAPSNVKAGYILRRILRRAIRYAHTLNLPYDAFEKLVVATGHVYGDAYPELLKNKAQIMEIFSREYNVFGKAVKKGMTAFERSLSTLQSSVFPGQQAFLLFSSYGFPLELIEEMLKERGLALDSEGFTNALDAHREISKKG